jgi:hypothetical protein
LTPNVSLDLHLKDVQAALDKLREAGWSITEAQAREAADIFADDWHAFRRSTGSEDGFWHPGECPAGGAGTVRGRAEEDARRDLARGDHPDP